METEHEAYGAFRIVYAEKKHRSDRTLTIWAESSAKALEKYENTKQVLNRKPLPGSTPKVYTEEEFAQLTPHYIIYQYGGREQFCYLITEDADAAEAKFAERFTTLPIAVLGKDDFKNFWQQVQDEKQISIQSLSMAAPVMA
ncbi:hypothetical protein ACFL2U_01630 [Patescibacteria group bacterium]